jgi:hypothetical protein
MNLSLAFNKLLDFTISQKSNSSYFLVFDDANNYTNQILISKKKRNTQNETSVANDMILKEPNHSYLILFLLFLLIIGVGVVVR